MKEDLLKVTYVLSLFDLYGELLSSRQKTILKDYYEENLSLSEIAENDNVSRNAVYDALKKAEEALFNYEASLHLYEKRKKYLLRLEKLYEEKHIDKISYELLKGEE